METPAAGLGLFMTASLGCNDDVDGKVFACGAKFTLQSARVTDAAFRVVDETQQMCAPSSVSITLDVGADLIGEILPAEPSPSFFHHDGQAIVIEEIGGAGSAIAIRRGPLVRADVIKMLAKERMHEVLHVALVLDVECRSVLAAQA